VLFIILFPYYLSIQLLGCKWVFIKLLCLQRAKCEHPRLINDEIIFEVFQPMWWWSWYLNVTDGQTLAVAMPRSAYIARHAVITVRKPPTLFCKRVCTLGKSTFELFVLHQTMNTHFLSQLQWLVVLQGCIRDPFHPWKTLYHVPQGPSVPGKTVFPWTPVNILAIYTGSNHELTFERNALVNSTDWLHLDTFPPIFSVTLDGATHGASISCPMHLGLSKRFLSK